MVASHAFGESARRGRRGGPESPVDNVAASQARLWLGVRRVATAPTAIRATPEPQRRGSPPQGTVRHPGPVRHTELPSNHGSTEQDGIGHGRKALTGTYYPPLRRVA